MNIIVFVVLAVCGNLGTGEPFDKETQYKAYFDTKVEAFAYVAENAGVINCSYKVYEAELKETFQDQEPAPQ